MGAGYILKEYIISQTRALNLILKPHSPKAKSVPYETPFNIYNTYKVTANLFFRYFSRLHFPKCLESARIHVSNYHTHSSIYTPNALFPGNRNTCTREKGASGPTEQGLRRSVIGVGYPRHPLAEFSHRLVKGNLFGSFFGIHFVCITICPPFAPTSRFSPCAAKILRPALGIPLPPYLISPSPHPSSGSAGPVLRGCPAVSISVVPGWWNLLPLLSSLC